MTLGHDSVRKINFQPYIGNVYVGDYFHAMEYLSWLKTPWQTPSHESLFDKVDFPYLRDLPVRRQLSGRNPRQLP